MNVATALAELSLPDDDGVPVRLADLWREQPVVLVFVRHFGCVFCREQVNQLKKILPDVRGRGAELAVIGNGDERYARAFREDLALDVSILIDHELAAYRAAGLRRDIGATLSIQVVKNAWRALKNGYRQRDVQGDPWQQGGVFVVAPGEQLLFSYVSEVAGDHPEPEAVLSAVPGAMSAAAAAE